MGLLCSLRRVILLLLLLLLQLGARVIVAPRGLSPVIGTSIAAALAIMRCRCRESSEALLLLGLAVVAARNVREAAALLMVLSATRAANAAALKQRRHLYGCRNDRAKEQIQQHQLVLLLIAIACGADQQPMSPKATPFIPQ